MLIILYVLISVFVGWLGRYKQIGFVGFLILSLVVTPVVAFFVLMMAQDRRERASS
jgi:hypothetical protein